MLAALHPIDGAALLTAAIVALFLIALIVGPKGKD
jgi:hypothetical protein